MEAGLDQFPFKHYWKSYLKLGLIPYPASKSGKNPIVPWKDDLPAPCSDDYSDWEEKYPDANIWVLIGDKFAVIDPDGKGAEEFVQSLNLPRCPTSITGNKSVHRFFKVSSPIKPLKIQNGDGTFLEVRTGNLGMLAPPSIHPDTKRPYQWMDGFSPWDVEFPELPEEAHEKIRALLPKIEPKPEPRMMPVQNGDNSLGALNVERYLTHYGIKFRVKPDSGRTFYLLDRCLFAEQHTTKDKTGDSSIIQGADGKLGYQCFHNHCSLKIWQDARKAISGEESLNQFIKRPNPYSSILINADNLISLEIPPRKIIIFPWLYLQQILLIHGWRGIGKTMFAISFFDAITRGEGTGPWPLVTPVPCLYIDGEMALIDIQERLKLLGAGKETPRKVPLMIYSDARANSLGLPRASLINTQWRKDAKSLMLDNGIQLVALDNIASLAPGLDENSKKDWDPINQWLIDLRFSDITVALLHHENKAGGQRGTSAREDNIDSTISLVRPHDYRIEDGCRFIVKFKKNRISTKDISLLQDYEFKLINNDGYSEWAWTTVRRKNQIEILRMLDEGISQTEITGMLSIDKAYVSRVKSKAVKEGQLSNSGKLTDSGFALVNSRDDEDEI